MYKCTPQEIIREVPDVQSVVLPSNWFDCLNDSRSVFVSLYEWMLDKGGVPSDNKVTLHGRTYVGEKLFSKLLVAEKKRLQKKLKIKGAELDSAVAWSDMDSGPKAEIGNCKIKGDAILVIPESSRQAMGVFSSKLFRKAHETAVNKIKVNAAGANFYQWLLSQVDRPDRVGDVARDTAIDDEFPRESILYEEIKRYFDSIGASAAAIESLKAGWLEYLQQYPDRVKPYAWCSECDKRLEVQEALLSWSLESSEVFILDATCLEKYREFDEIESLPLSSITPVDLEELAEKADISEFDIERLNESLKLWGIIPIASAEGHVYFVRSEKTHAIKIGFTAGKIEDRLSALQTAHPYKLQVLAASCGSREYEKALHGRFGHLRLEGEWFEPHPDLMAFIAVLPQYQQKQP